MQISISKRREKRIIAEAAFIIDTSSTLRATAKYFGVSKCTVHKDVTIALKELSYNSFQKIRIILDQNKKEATTRGGMATKNKYKLAGGECFEKKVQTSYKS